MDAAIYPIKLAIDEGFLIHFTEIDDSNTLKICVILSVRLKSKCSNRNLKNRTPLS